MSLKDCFWDYNISEDELKNIACGSDIKKKQWLFNRIVYNSPDKIHDLSIFNKKDLQNLFDNFKLSARLGLSSDSFSALRNTMLNERQYIEKFQWKKI
ncbi:hypothetical protein H0R92_00820 [Treponema sp. OMZ 840]|uniref:hypothetical protein n=1 Tax=Treponema sp. OMZ 840 TaxID=244313 RepID=UPI003D93D734